MPKVINRKNINIFQSINGIAEFSQLIDLDFVPDEMIIRTISYLNDGIEGPLSAVFCSLVNDFIGSFVDSKPYANNIVYTIGKPVRGQYNFQIRNADGTLNNVRAGDIHICLEFVQYAGKDKD